MYSTHIERYAVYFYVCVDDLPYTQPFVASTEMPLFQSNRSFPRVKRHHFEGDVWRRFLVRQLLPHAKVATVSTATKAHQNHKRPPT